MSKFSDALSKLADALDTAASAVREAEAAAGVGAAKSEDSATDGVASKPAGPKAKGAAAAAPVAAKPAKGGKAKAPAITFEILKAKLTDVVNAKGKDAAKEILSEFGAVKLVDLDEDSFADAYAKAVEALSEEDEVDSTADVDMFGD
jgi:hypothetical protein